MGVLGIVGSTTNETGYGRYETKRLWQFKTEYEPSWTGTAIESLLSTDVKNSLTIATRTIAKPTVTMSVVEIKHANEAYKIAGKTPWAPDTIESVYDEVIPKGATGDTPPLYSASSIFYSWLNLIQNVTNGTGSLSRDYKANIIVIQYDPAAREVERWLYHGCWPSEVRFGDNWDYTQDSEGFQTTVTWKVDKVFRVTPESGTTPPGEGDPTVLTEDAALP